MKSVVLSTTEAEYMALSEVVKELKVHCATVTNHEHYLAIKQQKYRRQNQTHRHKDSICEGVSRRWEDNHKVCEIRR